MPFLLLASSSIYRRQLLEKLQLPFDWASPDIDETPHAHEKPEELVQRLAHEKAKSLEKAYPEHLIIGSDQVASFQQQIIGKPGNHENAVAQLSLFNGQQIVFYTGLCLYNSQTKKSHLCVERFNVHFRSLNMNQIENYLHREKPYDCAGSFKSEGLGISLFQSMNGRDPNCLIGLPLMALVDLLLLEGIDVLGNQ
jgi:septum formation protein